MEHAGPVLVLFVKNDAIRAAVLRSRLVAEQLDPLKDEGLAVKYCSEFGLWFYMCLVFEFRVLPSFLPSPSMVD